MSQKTKRTGFLRRSTWLNKTKEIFQRHMNWAEFMQILTIKYLVFNLAADSTGHVVQRFYTPPKKLPRGHSTMFANSLAFFADFVCHMSLASGAVLLYKQTIISGGKIIKSYNQEFSFWIALTTIHLPNSKGIGSLQSRNANMHTQTIKPNNHYPRMMNYSSNRHIPPFLLTES